MAWLTYAGSNGLAYSWNYIVATAMHNATSTAYSPYNSSFGIAGVVYEHAGADKKTYFNRTIDRGADGFSSSQWGTLNGAGYNGALDFSNWIEMPHDGGFRYDRSKHILTSRSGADYDTNNYNVGLNMLICVRHVNADAGGGLDGCRPIAVSSGDTTDATMCTIGFDNGSTAPIGTSRSMTWGNLRGGTAPLVDVGNPFAIDLSFRLPENLFQDGCKANSEFRNMVCAAAIRHRLDDYKYRLIAPAGVGTAVLRLRAGVLADVDPNVPDNNPVIASFDIYSGDLSTPDVNGMFRVNTAKIVSASGTGTIGYAELTGYYSSTGVYPKLYMPVTTVPVDNAVVVDNITLSTGQSIQLIEFGLRFKMADVLT